MTSMVTLIVAVFIQILQGGHYARSEPTGSVIVTPHDLDLRVHDSAAISFTVSGNISECVNISFSSNPRQVTSLPTPVYLCTSDLPYTQNDTLTAVSPGIVTLEGQAEPVEILDLTEAYIRVSVIVTPVLNTIADIIGWIYTIAWDFSFLPQIYHNWKRHSVIGLSFDFLTFNFLGFSAYFVFNMGLLWIPAIQDEYHSRHPYAVLHVRLNDVIFPLYALVCTAVQITQCFFYKRAPGQRVSTPCLIITALLILSIIATAILVPTVPDFMWLDFLYWLSYVKLIITAIKYAPQLYVNYTHKSTEGWSIWQVILDFTGGTFSLIQMFLLAANYDDWISILTDPGKLGLGLLSIIFNILFFIQHYGLYRNQAIGDDYKKESPKELTSLQGETDSQSSSGSHDRFA